MKMAQQDLDQFRENPRLISVNYTDTSAAHESDDERLEPAGSADDPDKTNEQQHSEDVLDAREVDAEHGP